MKIPAFFVCIAADQIVDKGIVFAHNARAIFLLQKILWLFFDFFHVYPRYH